MGAVLLTRDKVEEVVRGLVNDARLSSEDARRLTEELVETGERQWEEMDRAVTETLRKALDKMDVGRGKEVEKLKARLENVEKRLRRLEELSPGATGTGK
jgi:polyhydroxyalkanoate synthesis regulator phasin